MQLNDNTDSTHNLSGPPHLYWLLGIALLLGLTALSPLGLAFIVPSLSFIPLPFPWFYAGAACIALLIVLIVEWGYKDKLQKAASAKRLHRAAIILVTCDLVIYAFLIPSSLTHFH